MSLQKSEPGLSQIINIQVLNETHKGWFLTARKGKFGFLFDFINPKGKMFSIKGNSDLLTKMSIIPEKSWVEITLIGKETQRSGNEMKVFKVLYDKENNYNIQDDDYVPPIDSNPREPGQEG